MAVANSTPEDSINTAFPGADPLHTSVREALRKLLHAGICAEGHVQGIAYLISRYIEEPPWSIWYGPEYAEDLASQLEHLARELRRACSALNSAKPHWQRFKDSTQEGSADATAPSHTIPTIGIRDHRPDTIGDEAPF